MQQLIGWRSFVVSSLAIIGHVNTGRDGGTRRHAIAMRTDSDSDARGNPCIYPSLSKI